MYTAYSSYIEDDPLNLGVLAPTSEGKTYPIVESLKYFPDEDVLYIGQMSTKVLVRQRGTLIDKIDGTPIEDKLNELKKKARELTNKKSMERDRFIKTEINEEIQKIDEDIISLYENSKTLIDLTGKILVFLEPPHHELWNLLKPILSHDKKEIEFPYVNTTEKGGIQTKDVVVRGWPSCIFCSAKDESKWEIWSEIKSRLLVTSPNMIPQKYQESNQLIAKTKGLPNIIQEQIIISEDQVNTTKQCVLLLKQKINELKEKNGNNNKISLWIPYHDLLQKILPANKGTDVRFAKKLFSLLNVVPIVKNNQRMMMNIEGETSIIADISDLKEVLSITQNFDGIPKFKIEFYNEIFLLCYQAKTEPDSNIDNSKTEEIIAVTTKQLCEFFKEKKGKPISTDNLKRTYLNQFINEGLIDYTESKIHSRQYIYYPLVTESLSISSIMSPIDKVSQQKSTIYEKIIQNTSKEWIFCAIMRLLRYRLDQTSYPLFDYIEDKEKFWILDNNQASEERNNEGNTNFITIGEFVDKYAVGFSTPIDNKPSPILLSFAKRSPFLSILSKIDNIDENVQEKDKNGTPEISSTGIWENKHENGTTSGRMET
ncbi:MAG: hypothetical protein ACPKPY_02170 [Nitrososphaeraceae archaeon]